MALNTLELHEIASNYLQVSNRDEAYSFVRKYKDAPPKFRKELLQTIADFVSAAAKSNEEEALESDLYDIGWLCVALESAQYALESYLPMSLVFSVPTLVWLAAAAYELGETNQDLENLNPIETSLGHCMGRIARRAVGDNT